MQLLNEKWERGPMKKTMTWRSILNVSVYALGLFGLLVSRLRSGPPEDPIVDYFMWLGFLSLLGLLILELFGLLDWKTNE